MAHNRIVDQALSDMVEVAGTEETAEQAEIAVLYCLARLRELREVGRRRQEVATAQDRRRAWYLASEGRPTIIE